MSIYIIQVASLLILSFLLINVYFIIADELNIIDKPNHRSSHKKITIRGGGIIIPLVFIIYELINHIPDPYFFSGLILISVVSFIDDVKGLSSKIRLGAQMPSVMLLLTDAGISSYLIALIVLIIITGFINGYNFMDGINGITGIYSLVFIGSLMYVNEYVTHFIDSRIFIYLIIPLVVFLIYNFRDKAKCFAGDIGSVSLAYILSFIILLLVIKTQNILYLLFMVVYGIDVVFTIVQRLILKQNIFEAHRMHLYQYLANEARFSHRMVSVIYGVVQLLINMFVVLKTNLMFSYQLLLFIIIVALLTLLYSIIKYRIVSKYKIGYKG
jgi:UDP-N-acetylmuramyl pentapeptide phosphotransferase/UDP-N-acetylglucosamine-1-phosphate transferase